jgi:hypothetical protein
MPRRVGNGGVSAALADSKKSRLAIAGGLRGDTRQMFDILDEFAPSNVHLSDPNNS